MILQKSIPYDATAKPLPGIAPLAKDGWIIQDQVYAKQMALRDDLLNHHRDSVWAQAAPTPAAKTDVLHMVLEILANRPGFHVTDAYIQRPDGVQVPRSDDPMITAARLVQEDLLLHEKRDGAWTLTAGVLCFPASWTLSEKIGKNLFHIHNPVPEYDDDMGARVARLFDGVQAERPLWRHNALTYADPSLHHPRTEASPRDGDHEGGYLRSEHQALVRLPVSGAVLFAIHTYVVENKSANGG